MQDQLLQLRDLVKSEEWRAFQKILKAHYDYLGDQALRSLDQGKTEQAVHFTVRRRECAAILSLVDEPLSKLKKEDE